MNCPLDIGSLRGQARVQARSHRRCQAVACRAAEHGQHGVIDRRSALLGAAVVAVVPPSTQFAKSEPTTLTIEDVTPAVVPASPLTARELQVIDVYERNTYSVVNIFDATIPGRGIAGNPELDVPEGNGSGIVWDRQGHIITNFHVLGNSLKNLKDLPAPSASSPPPFQALPGGPPLRRVARVTLLGENGLQQTFDGWLVGADRNRDLAVVRINAPPEQLRPISLGTSKDLRVGQQVLAIGCPFGFDHSVTTGVISGLNREIKSLVGTSIPGGLQVDAAINPGNSGGPLLNSAGNLVGINTAIFTNTGTSVGIGFAIPVDIISRVVPQLIQVGKVTRPSLGVQISTAATAARLQVLRGALVQAVVPGGPGEKAGILATRRGLQGIIVGDTIVKVEGKPILAEADLTNALDLLSVGQTVTVIVQRAGDGGSRQEVELKAVLAAE